MFNCCWHGNLPHFSPQPVPPGVPRGTRLNTCYCNQDLLHGPLFPPSRGRVNAGPCVPLRAVALHISGPPQHAAIQSHRGWLGHHPFWELPPSAGELLHIPQRIPTFMATVLLSLAGSILYGVWNEPTLGPVRQQIGSSRVASTAYQWWPTRSQHVPCLCMSPIKQPHPMVDQGEPWVDRQPCPDPQRPGCFCPMLR